MPTPQVTNYTEMPIGKLESLVRDLGGHTEQKWSVGAAVDTLTNERFPDTSCDASKSLLLAVAGADERHLSMVAAFIERVRPNLKVQDEQLQVTPTSLRDSSLAGLRPVTRAILEAQLRRTDNN